MSHLKSNVPSETSSINKKMLVQTLLGDCPTWVIVGTQAELEPALEDTDEKCNSDFK